MLQEQLKTYLQAHDLTAEQLARQLGVTLGTVNRWKSGKTLHPCQPYAEKLAELGIGVDNRDIPVEV